MNVDALDTAAGIARAGKRAAAAEPGAFAELTVGQELRLRVLRRLDGGEYLVARGTEREIVASDVTLTPGTRIVVRVTSAGERLTLRYVATERQKRAAAERDLIDRLAEQHGLALLPQQRAQLEAAAADSADPGRMILSGLFLEKLGLPLEQGTLQALFSAQIEGAAAAVRATSSAPEPKRSARAELAADSADRVAELLAEAFDDGVSMAAPEGGAATGDSRGDSEPANEREVRIALNSQDGGSVGYRYATLPLLVAGELTELQLALFTPRRVDERGVRVRRLVMTFEVPSLRQIRIEAKSVDQRIAVAIDASAPAAVEALASHEPAVRELLAQLGWAVEHVSYGVNVPPDRAARRIVDHVLASGTVDETF